MPSKKSPKKSPKPKKSTKYRARTHSQAELSPENKASKSQKMELDDIEALLDKKIDKMSAEQNKNFVDLSTKFDNLGIDLGNKIESVKNDITEIKQKQVTETEERLKLGTEVELLKEQVQTLLDQRQTNQNPDIDELAQKLLPKISKNFEKELNSSHIQNLVHEIRKTESGAMLFGYKPEGGPDLVAEIREKILKDKLKVDFEVGSFRAEKFGRGDPGKREAPIMLTFSSFIVRNQILRLGSNLPKGLNIEKCLPVEYRAKNKDFLKLGWQLKQVMKNTIKTRVILVGHILCLQIKKNDEGGIKYDWVIHKEFCPPQSTPTDKKDAQKSRPGLTATPQLSDKDKAFIIFSALTPDPNGDKPIRSYFEREYLEFDHREQMQMVEVIDQTDQFRLIIKLANKSLCEEWKEIYSKKDFNGTPPTIELHI